MDYFKIIIVLLLSVSLFTCKKEDVSGEQAERFVKYYGGALGNHAYDVKQTSDGGYIIVGTTTTSDKADQAILIKTDVHGNQLWQQTFGGSDNDEGRSVQVMPDGGFILLGTYTGTNKNMFLVKTDASGNQVFENNSIGYGAITDEEGYCVQVCPDGDFLLVGSTTGNDSSAASADKNVFLIKMASDGITKRWSALRGYTNDDIGYFAHVVNDSTFFLTGKTSGQGLSGSNVWTLLAFTYPNTKYTSPAITPFDPYGSNGDDEAVWCQALSNGNYILVGSQGNDIYLTNLLLTNFDPVTQPTINYNGSAWPKIFGSTAAGVVKTIGKSVQPTTDGGYIILATAEKSAIDHDQYLVKTDANGNKVWEQSFGGTGKDDGGVVIQASDGGYALVGSTEFGSNSMISLIKVTTEGKLQK